MVHTPVPVQLILCFSLKTVKLHTLHYNVRLRMYFLSSLQTKLAAATAQCYNYNHNTKNMQ